ncbi:methyl-accepting chemotaxis protein [Bacillus sp. RG28]|uniref:Methyl-accepting chemotaxis protein n=1 Tax=Gottfriedia endophytica TaxID=2820819 RepID=A0A940SIN8_9BACI|nr:methyl-accepting chemotaxis protein [Gottfriedia endophytica]MBP0725180.1 methyl-accepting chemotaxis protein [Gottfriedia endophytica]
MKKLKIRTKLLLFLIFILVVPSIMIGLISYNSAKNKLQQNIIKSATENVTLLNRSVQDTISSHYELIDFLSHKINKSMFEEKNTSILTENFKDLVTTHNEVSSAYTGTEDGKMFQYPYESMPAGYDPRTRDWYKKAKEHQGEMIITSPYEDASTKSLIVTIAKELPDGSGVVALDIQLNELRKVVLDVKIGEHGFPMILDDHQKVVIHPTLKQGSTLPNNVINPIFNSEKGQFSYTLNGTPKEMVFETNKITGWKISGIIQDDEFKQQANPILMTTVYVVIAFILVGAVITFFILRMIINPINQLITVTEQVSNGDLTVRVPINSNDEFGILGKAFNQMINSLLQLINKINFTSHRLTESSENLALTIEQVKDITKEMNNSMEVMSRGAEVQMTSTKESAVATEEIATGVQYVAEKLSVASESSTDATKNVEEGSVHIQKGISEMESIHHSVEHSSSLVQELGKKSEEINTIINVINSISEQTNLLALNASIEAARAGEHGKGFAVVAQEIRKLAEGSKTSTVKISEILSSVQAETNLIIEAMEQEKTKTINGLHAIKQTGEKFTQVSESISKVNQQIQEVSATSEQISAATEEVTASFTEISQIATESFQSTEAAANESKEQLKMAEEINSSVNELAKLAIELKKEIESFKTEEE